MSTVEELREYKMLLDEKECETLGQRFSEGRQISLR